MKLIPLRVKVVTILLAITSLITVPIATSSASSPGLIPQLEISSQRQNDFSLRILNFDPAWEFSATSDKGVAIVDRAGNISIVELQPLDFARVTVVSRRPGYFDGKASINGGVMGTTFKNDATTINASDGTEVVQATPSAAPTSVSVRSMSFTRMASNKYVFTIKSSQSEKLVLQIKLKKVLFNKTISVQAGKALAVNVAQVLKGATATLTVDKKIIRTLSVNK